jgi:hypothetical protein
MPSNLRDAQRKPRRLCVQGAASDITRNRAPVRPVGGVRPNGPIARCVRRIHLIGWDRFDRWASRPCPRKAKRCSILSSCGADVSGCTGMPCCLPTWSHTPAEVKPSHVVAAPRVSKKTRRLSRCSGREGRLSSEVAIELQCGLVRYVFVLRISLSLVSAATFVCGRRRVGAMEMFTMPAQRPTR